MNELSPLTATVTLPEHWDYEKSVRRSRSLALKWGNLTSALLHELWVAREMLSQRPEGPKLVTNVTSFRAKTWVQYCGDVGLERMTVHRWLTRYDVVAGRIEEPKPHVAQNTGDSEWYTPQVYTDAARVVMGEIDLDPASTPEANEVVRAKHYFTAEDNGLSQPWQGRVWMNPPYASELIGPFCDKLITEVGTGATGEATVLTNNATETRWFQALMGVASAVCFPLGRVRFWHRDKESVPLQGQAVIYIGENTDSFIKEFGSFGVTCLVVR